MPPTDPSSVPTPQSVAGNDRLGLNRVLLARLVVQPGVGISGHAGLFGTAYDVHTIAHELVAAYHGNRSIFSRDVIRRMFDHRTGCEGPTRALGWDVPAPKSSSAGSCFGKNTVGHLGFTGTSLWIDLKARNWIVLLTNRVYYGREPNPMPRLRPRVHDAVWRAALT